MGSVGETEKVPTTIDRVRLDAFQLVTMSALPGALAALARLNIFEALAKAGDDAQLTAAELAERALPGKSINMSYLSRLLRMVSGKNILREVVTTTGDKNGAPVAVERRYALEPIARFLVDDPERGSFVHLLLTYQSPGAFLQTWEHLHESVLDDAIQPFARAHGMNAWEFGKHNPQFDKVFNKAMAGNSKIYMRAILDAYHGFEDVKVVVDVGGGFAAALSLITARYPHIKGINFDQPHVIDVCPELPGVEHVSGNMFESVPSGGDAIFMKYILHDWDDESCLKILKNCYQALPAHGKVIAVDNMLPEIIDFEGGDPMALQVDIHMLAFNDSGARERTERELVKLGLAAGFNKVKVVCKVDLLAVTEFHKA
ncbi:hypothetical protein KC19_4G137000 [Ceratodon purpureus]|uniref:Uncharacterized protein n=1 Tax=Ceratodon purpureus TaxID=3225 RepID=A0A8T0IAJ3_CERPU|nr:hypothetical protein KC19_4G137000 [Ceratodon purpureus]